MKVVLLSVALFVSSLYSGAQIISQHFVELDTVIYGESNAYWLYTITNGTSPDISHVVFDSNACLELLSAGSWSGDLDNPNYKDYLGSNPIEIQKDPTTDKSGIKFDDFFFDGEETAYIYLEYDRPTKGEIDTVWFKSGNEVTYKLVDVAACEALPVTMSRYSASRNSEFVTLSWSTASELNNNYFDIQRLSENGVFESVAQVQGFGTTNETQNYEYKVLDLRSGTVYYRLRQVDFDGTEEIFPALPVHQFNKSTWTIASSESQIFVTNTGVEGLRVIDCLGNEVLNIQGSTQNRKSIVISKSELPTGLVLIQDKSTQEVRKVIIN